MNYQSELPATQFLLSQGLFKDCPFTLIDIGCSGGIAKSWRVFGNSLRVYAIDPMLSEIDKLRKAETNPNVTYHPGYIGLPPDHPIVRSRGGAGSVGNNPWSRLSTAWALEVAAKDNDDTDTKVKHNRWPETHLADSSTLMTLGDFIRKHQIDDVDFIKVDIDGNDFYALVSCEEMIDPCGVLGFMLEVNYCGTDSDTDHTFHNTDRFMRKHHFELLDLTIRRYSRRALPAPFTQRMFAQTSWGPPLQGDAVYLRDLAGPEVLKEPRLLSHDKVLKAVAICEIFGLPDCAAELITAHRQELSRFFAIDELLDLLTPEVNGRKVSYREYLRMFSESPEAFYPQPGIQRRGGRNENGWTRRLKRNMRYLASRLGPHPKP
jgi:FkbM family methyltransferase